MVEKLQVGLTEMIIIAKSEIFRQQGCWDSRIIVQWDPAKPKESRYSTHMMVIPDMEGMKPFFIWGHYDLDFLDVSMDFHNRRTGLRKNAHPMPKRTYSKMVTA